VKKLLIGKDILFIGPVFHNYEKHIIAAFEGKGYGVDFFSEKPYVENVIFFYLSRYFPNLYRLLADRYFNYQFKRIKKEYEYLLLIRGEIIDRKFMGKLLSGVSFKHKVLYQWDSLESVSGVKEILKCFDKVASFDYEDCNNFSFDYLPLFYVNNYKLENRINLKYDVSFVGVYHSNRHKYISQIKQYCLENNFSIKIRLKVTPARFILLKLFNRSFRDFSLKDVVFRDIPLSEVYNIFNNSKVVLDIVNEKQSGLTMRTFETLGNGKKLLTNNKYISREWFYNEKNICFFDDFNSRFILEDGVDCDMDNYLIHNWAEQLLHIE
jgi:hypothetical protein